MNAARDADATLRATANAFTPAPTTVHEELARLEFFLRCIFGIAYRDVLSSSTARFELARTPGLGALRRALTTAYSAATDPACREIAEAALRALGRSLGSLGLAYAPNVESLRNHLLHGGALPSAEVGSRAAALVRSIFSDLVDDAAQAIKGCVVLSDAEGRAVIRTQTRDHALHPLLRLTSDGRFFEAFTRRTSRGLVLTAPQCDELTILPDTQLPPELERIFRTTRADSLLSDFVQHIFDDLDGFKEPGTTISLVSSDDGDGGAVRVEWQHADGSTTVDRQDLFRIGLDNQWQWRGQTGDWRGYSEGLMELARWDVLCNRLRRLLDERVNEAHRADEQLLPLNGHNLAPNIPLEFSIRPFEGKPKDAGIDDLVAQLDRDVATDRGAPRLYFIHAEAGAGKTTALLDLAHTRAVSAVGGVTRRPLFIYVSSRGNVLENLDQAVNATVARTQLLNAASVRALCRNGLIIPIIDGFDELVGTPTYTDALASLRPWIAQLGGRGVMIVSARSSYFIKLYEAAVQRDSNADLDVDHIIVTLKPLSEAAAVRFLRDSGVSVDLLSAGELKLMSLPFFLRAAVSALSQQAHPKDLLDCIIDDYLSREQSKLTEDGNPLLNRMQLRSLFCEAAALMAQNATREISSEELNLCCHIATDREPSAHLARRLVALCGLGAGREQSRAMRFSHEVFFDFFLGMHVAAQLGTAGATVAVGRLLGQVQIQQATARIALRGIPTKEVVGLIHSLTSSSSTSSELRAANLGVLWLEACRLGGGLARARIARASFGDWDFESNPITETTFESCAFLSVVLGGVGHQHVRFAECEIEEAEVTAASLRWLSLERTEIDCLVLQHEVVDEAAEVARRLIDAGAAVSPIPTEPRVPEGPAATARYLLEQIVKRRSGSRIVVGENRFPEDDQAFKWIARFGDAWLAFINTLLRHQLARLVPKDASGSAKWRLKFVVPANLILEGSGAGPKGFWDELQG